MKFFGNYKHLIKPEWIDLLLTTKGIPISPFKDHDPSNNEKEKDINLTLAKSKQEYSLFQDGVYGDNLIMAEIFDRRNCPFKLDLEELNQFLNGDWWIVKQMPGQFMPLHRDTANIHDKNYRFWMPWKDYEAGHVFIHENRLISNYKAGDIYQYNKDNDLHGSANIGFSSRIVLQISSKELP